MGMWEEHQLTGASGQEQARWHLPGWAGPPPPAVTSRSLPVGVGAGLAAGRSRGKELLLAQLTCGEQQAGDVAGGTWARGSLPALHTAGSRTSASESNRL